MRLIDADALVKNVVETVPDLRRFSLKTFGEALDKTPTINAAPERTGTWSEEYDPNDDLFFRRKYRCSACGDWNTYGFTKYCPNCGAKMRNAYALTMEKVMEQ